MVEQLPPQDNSLIQRLVTRQATSGNAERPISKVDQAGNALIGCWARSWLINAVIEAIEEKAPQLSDRKEKLKEKLAQENQDLTTQALQRYQEIRRHNLWGKLTHQDGRIPPQQQDLRVSQEVINPLLTIAQKTEGCEGQCGLGKLLLKAAEPAGNEDVTRLLRKYGLDPKELVSSVTKAVEELKKTLTVPSSQSLSL